MFLEQRLGHSGGSFNVLIFFFLFFFFDDYFDILIVY